MANRAIEKQKKVLSDALAEADDRLRLLQSRFVDDDAVELEYFAHGMEGLVDVFQKVANEAGYLAELIDPNVREKV